MAELVSMQNEKQKEKKLKQNFGLLSLGIVRLDITELHRCENHILFLPVYILTVWHAGFLGNTIQYHVS